VNMVERSPNVHEIHRTFFDVRWSAPRAFVGSTYIFFSESSLFPFNSKGKNPEIS
jgi:hypothetical protein